MQPMIHPQRHTVFVTGGTGYVGRPLITQLLASGHEVRALVRSRSEKKLPPGCHAIPGNALDGKSLRVEDRTSRYICAFGRRFASQPVEGCGVPQH
jgi:nucleoside-diphosphate-sugar epimerase